MVLKRAALAASLFLTAGPAAAQFPLKPSPSSEETGIYCQDWRQKSNGAWTPLRKVTLKSKSGTFTVEPDEQFGIEPGGANPFNLKIARFLNDNCR